MVIPAVFHVGLNHLPDVSSGSVQGKLLIKQATAKCNYTGAPVGIVVSTVTKLGKSRADMGGQL